MIQDPKVTIIIPVYNGSNYLDRAIHSALSQTYKNIEVIVVNDGSNDNLQTEIIAQKYTTQIKYLSKDNGGVASALNYAISVATGDYFSWLSHDDEYFESKIENQIKLIKKAGTPNAIVYSGYELIDSNSDYLYTVRPDFVLSKSELNMSLLPLIRGLINGCTLLIPFSKFKEFGLFNENLRSAQDYDMWFRMLRGTKLIYDNNICVKTRIHPNQSTYLNKDYEEEANEIWIRFLEQTSLNEISNMNLSPRVFYESLANFLAAMKLKKAGNVAKLMLNNYPRKKYSERLKVYRKNLAIITSILISPIKIKHLFNWAFYLIKNQSHDDFLSKIKYIFFK